MVSGSQKSMDSEVYTDLKPDGRTFSIWALIYLLEFFFAMYQVILAFAGGETSLFITNEIRFYTCAAFVLNGIWLLLNDAKLNW